MSSIISQSEASSLGPLVDLASELQDGSLPLATAKQIAGRYGSNGEVSFEQAVWMSDTALRIARKGNWRLALLIGEVTYEASRSAVQTHPKDRSFGEALGASGANLLVIIHHGVIKLGDIRFYLRAKEIAEEAIPSAARFGLPHWQGLVSLAHGQLLLGAYTANRSPGGYEAQFAAWLARARRTNDPVLTEMITDRILPSGEPDPKHPAVTWPEPLDGLAEAEGRLRAALPLVDDKRRAEALLALSRTIEWRGELSGATDREELRSVTEQALAALDPKDQKRLGLIATLRRLGVIPEGDDLVRRLEGEVIRRLEGEWTEFAAEHTEHVAWEAVSQAVDLICESEPERGLALLERQRELKVLWADEGLRARHFGQELLCFTRAYAPATLRVAREDLSRANEGLQELFAAAVTPEGSRAAAAGVVAVTLAAAAAEQEATALTHLGTLFTLHSLDSSLWEQREDALVFLIASLKRDRGVSRMNSKDFDTASTYYWQAADAFLEAGMPSTALECVEYLDGAVTSGATNLIEITVWLASTSLSFELPAPSAAPAVLQSLAGDLLAALSAVGATPRPVQLLIGVAKGRRFAAMLAEGTRDFALDEHARQMLEREAQAEAALPADSELLRPASSDAAPGDAALGEDALDDDDLITAWVNEYEEGPAETPADRVASMRRAIERRLSATLVPEQLPSLIDLDEIKRRLDERTALLQLLEGPSTDGRVVTYQVLITREFEQATACVDRMPFAAVAGSWQGHSFMMPPSGFYVGAFRRAIQANPDPLDLTPEAAAHLEGGARRYTHVIDMCRERLEAAGIDRLVIAPHGSNRFVPLHLVGPPGDLLADRFTVSYITSLAQLTLEPPVLRHDGVGVFGLSYADQPRLPRLDDSGAEAEAIAAACGATAVLDEAATEEAFKRALESKRYVHLRAHGKLFLDAPSFHTVFLHPDGREDGRLRAYELLPLDLTGLELVTLGACETALGRVDRSDNPRGLPAALLLAGAQAVIGTLWPVLASASTCFFTQLYRALVEDGGDVAAAFAVAQRATRELRPQYRDWGAFYLTGGLGQRGET
jgi:hypothetical protein